MKKCFFFTLIICLTVLICGGCGEKKEEMVIEETSSAGVLHTAPSSIVIEEETTAAAETAAPAATAEESTTAALYDLYGDLKGRLFEFSSGTGGWCTELEIFPDGTFKGNYHDSDMGDTGDGYPDGTIYICSFTGSLDEPVKTGDHTFSAKVKELKYQTAYDNGSAQEIEDGIRWILTCPYGISEGSEIEIYDKGKKVSELDEVFLTWGMWAIPEDADELDCFAIYVMSDAAVFWEDPY